ncbi:MAG: sugar isomerase [Candidatus Melainabacteria bacterium]|nr:MAG: sugar isomerase [Candidatus Melainabacteria bacterium]
MSFSRDFLAHCAKVIETIDADALESAAQHLAKVRDREGRLFIIGSGGGAGHASHATCDFRKICNIETYAPYDNVSELTARVNDEGWDTTLSNWLKVSRLSSRDGLLVFSVGGGSTERNISPNLVNAVAFAKERGATIVGIVGKDGGYTAREADAAIIIPPVESNLVTPLTEGFQAVMWHLLVSHPLLQVNAAKWESETLKA